MTVSGKKFLCDFTSVVVNKEVMTAPLPPATAWDRILNEIEKSGKLIEVWPPYLRRRAIECPTCKGLGVRYVAVARRQGSDQASV